MKLKLYSKKKEDNDQDIGDAALVGGGVVTAGSLASPKVRSRLTGKVVRYHNTPVENVESILNEGLKASKANDPNSFTRTVLSHLKDDPSLDNLVYTSKSRQGANSTGSARSMYKEGRRTPNADDMRELLFPKKNKTLKIELDYDKDVKGSRRIENPELLGAKNWKEYHNRRPGIFKDELESKELFESLGKGTHIFDHDISSSKIVGGKGYKKRTLKDVKEYIKKNPKRFAKGAAPIVLGTGLMATGVYLKKRRKKK